MKEKVLNRCHQILDEKIELIKTRLQELKESAASEDKSSAGDKHETGRAMIQLEQEKTGKQLDGLLNQKEELNKMVLHSENKSIVKGSLVKTNKGFLFISTAIGKMSIDNETVFAISPQSPIGLKIMGLKEKDETEVNGNHYKIEYIL